MTVLFCNVHALVQHRRPFTDYPWMLELDKKKGIDVGNTYHTDKEAQKFSFYIAQEARNNITKFINKCPFISVITDGATDKSVKEQEIVYCRSSNGGLVDSFYIGIGEPERADANGIISVIDSVFGSLDIKHYRHKLVGFGSDGASVNTGKKNGVIAKLKESQPSIVGVHCHAHRLELAYKDAMRKYPSHKVLEELLDGLYLFYHNSPLNRSDLGRACEVLDVPKVVPTRIGGTRWVSHWLRALENLWKAYPGIVSHLQTV